MRSLGLFAAAFACLAATGCMDQQCTPAADKAVTFDMAALTPSTLAPLCSKCGGPVENPSYECQSTCAAADTDAEAEGGTDQDAQAGPSTVDTCLVDSCLAAVSGAGGSCNAICALLYPTDEIDDCSIEGGTALSCTVHIAEVCK
jgi:hypothetical protein